MIEISRPYRLCGGSVIHLALVLVVTLSGFLPAFHAAVHGDDSVHAVRCADRENLLCDIAKLSAADETGASDVLCGLCSVPVTLSSLDVGVISSLIAISPATPTLTNLSARTLTRTGGTHPPRGPPVRTSRQIS